MITTEHEYKLTKEAYLSTEVALHQFNMMHDNPKLEGSRMKTLRHELIASRDRLLKELKAYEAIPKETVLCS